MELFLGRPSTRQAHFDALDGLRGLAVMVVIASHLSLLGWLPGLPMGGAGKSGVYLFFVLSAFLLTRMLLDRSPSRFADPWLWAGYALRRVLRIWPLYLIVLSLSWILTTQGATWWHYRIDTAALVGHLTLQQGQSVLWSIPVEFKFYLWLPVVAFALAWMAHHRWPPAAQALVALAALAACTVLWPPAETGRNDVRLGPYLVLFLCGGFAAAVDRWLEGRGQARWTWGAAGLAAFAAVTASVPAAWAAMTGTAVDLRLNHAWFLFFGIAWSTLLLAVLHGPAWLRVVFASAPMRLVGVVSFSAYLWHMPVIDLLRVAGVREWPGAAPVALAAILCVSMASFLLLERPWREVRLPPLARRDGSARRSG